MVSIKIIPGDGRYFPVFIVLSLLIHVLFFFALSTFGALPVGMFAHFSPKSKDPVTVEVVELPKKKSEFDRKELVTLPPEPEGKPVRPKEVTRLAERSQTVEVEEAPELRASSGVSGATPAQAKAQAAKKLLVEPSPQKSREETGKRAGAGLITANSLISGEGKFSRARAGAGGVGKAAGRAGDASSGVREKAPLSLIPSEEKLQQIAGKQESVRGQESLKRGKRLLLNTGEFKYYKYFNGIKRRIDFYWEYPPVAGRNGQQGRLQIEFTINKDGSVDKNGIRLLKSSNYPILDDAAITAIRLAAPFNPFPEDLKEEKITIDGSFVYSLLGYGRGR